MERRLRWRNETSHQSFIDEKVQLPQLDLPCIVAAEPATAWHRVVLFADTKAMEMKVRPVKADLQDGVKIGQGAIGSHEKAPPEHRVDPSNPDVDTVSFALRIVFSLRGPAYQVDNASALPSPRFEMLSFRRNASGEPKKSTCTE